MAAGVESVLEREITCALCLNIFQEPKKLPCDHVFCKACLEMLSKRNVTHSISCPECRRLAHLPNGVVEGLPTDFRMNCLIDVFQRVTLRDQEQEDTTRQAEAPAVRRTKLAAPQATARVPAHTRDESHRQWEEWVNVGHEDILTSGSGSQMSEWQRMQAMREREQRAMTERPQTNPGNNGTAAKFSRFFSQLKTEFNVFVQGIKQLGRFQNQEYRPRTSPSAERASTTATQSGSQQQAIPSRDISPQSGSRTVLTELLRDKNHEIGALHQELQAKRQQEEQQKQEVERLQRQLQDLNMRQHHKEQVQLLRDTQQLEGGISFFLELPNTLTYRIIAQHPKISGKLLDYAKSHGVEIHFTEAESNIKATLSGIPDAFEDVQTNLVSLDHQLQEMIGIKYEQMHCAILPLLLDSRVSKALADIESKYHVEICVADNTGAVISVKKFIPLLQSECADRSLLTVHLTDISVPSEYINVVYSWKVKNDRGNKIIVLPSQVNKYLNKTFFIDKKDEAKFEFNGICYTANVSTMCIVEMETGVKKSLDAEVVAPTWSYIISEDEYVAHEVRDCESLEGMYRHGGSFVTLAGSRHTLDLSHMQQIDLETGHRIALKRDPVIGHTEAPQYFITFAIRGLQNSLEVAKQAVVRKFKSFCRTVNFTADLLPNVSRDWQDILLIQMLNTARQYCIKLGANTLDNAKITIELIGAKNVLDKVQSVLKEHSFDVQHQIISRQLQWPCVEDKYPPEWEPQTHDFDLIAVRHKNLEWKSIEGLMKRTLQNIKIIQLHRIQNQQLWDKYALEKKHMSERNDGKVNEMKLFHGTRNTDPKVIVQAVRGIDFRYSRCDHPLLWGAGAYFAVNASYSDRYCYIDDSSGMKQLLLVRVLTGYSCRYEKRNDPDLRKPPPLSQGSHVLYDTINGYTNGSTVYVVYDHDRAYPAYLITYYSN